MQKTPIAQKVTSKDGTKIAFWKSGAGPPLLLIHGTTANHKRWLGILPDLEQHFSVYSMDRRGRGASSDRPDYDIIREAEDIAAVLEYIDEPVYVLGHSYGAVCALEASLLTDNVRRLVLYEPPIPTSIPMYPPHVPDNMQSLIDQNESEKALEVFFLEVVRMPEQQLIEYRRLPMWKERIQLAHTIPRELAIDRSYQFDSDRFIGFEIPTLLLLGGDSPDLFKRAIALLHSSLPTSIVDTLPGQQHIAMDTDPELFVKEVLKFISE